MPVLCQVGRGRILVEGERVALLGYGTAMQSCLAAAALVEKTGLKVTVADARFCKPLDQALVRRLAKSHEVLITVEEGSIGGFGSHVAQYMALSGLLDGATKVINPFTAISGRCCRWNGGETLQQRQQLMISRSLSLFFSVQWRPIVLPDRYIEHGAPGDQLAEAGLTPSHIAATVFNILGQTREALEMMS